jgi:hypothetical protein
MVEGWGCGRQPECWAEVPITVATTTCLSEQPCQDSDTLSRLQGRDPDSRLLEGLQPREIVFWVHVGGDEDSEFDHT